jgi:hypothetical protein
MAEKIGIPDMLNHWARAYIKARGSEKRECLRRYLGFLEIAAVESYPWSALLGEKPIFDLRPLHALKECLRQIDNRESPSLFAPPKGNGAPPTPRFDQFWWARAAAIITVLMRDFGKTEDDAAKLVAQKLTTRGLGVPGRSRGPSWKNLQAWRDKLMAGKKGKLATAWYDETLFLILPLYKTESELINSTLDPAQIPYDPLGF